MYAVSVLLVANLWMSWNSGSLYQISESVMKDVPYQARTSAVRNERGCEGFMILDATAMILRSVDTMRILTALMGWKRICCHLTDGIVNEKRVRGQGKELFGEDSLAITMQMDEMVWNERKKKESESSEADYIRSFDHCIEGTGSFKASSNASNTPHSHPCKKCGGRDLLLPIRTYISLKAGTMLKVRISKARISKVRN
jgi:hypothetical protein